MILRKLPLPHLSAALLVYWACLLGALYLFSELAGEVYEREGFFFDAPVLGWFADHRTAWLVGAARAFSAVGSPVMLGFFAFGAALCRGPRSAVFLASVWAGRCSSTFCSSSFLLEPALLCSGSSRLHRGILS